MLLICSHIKYFHSMNSFLGIFLLETILKELKHIAAKKKMQIDQTFTKLVFLVLLTITTRKNF